MNNVTRPSDSVVAFGRFRLDVTDRRLWDGDEAVRLPPKAFDLLRVLVARANQAVSKAELLEQVWPNTFVEEGVLAVNVSTLRRVLGDEQAAVIQTVPRVGYRFVADVHAIDAPRSGPLPAPMRAPPSATPDPLTPEAAPGAIASAGASHDRRARFVALAALVVATIGGFGWYWTSRSSARPIQSMAVLPFTAIAADANQQHLTLGMTDAIITGLGRTGALRVPPTATIRHFIADTRHPTDIGRELGVEAVLTGTLLRAEDRLRLTLQLTRVSDGVQLWTGRFDEKFTGIFSVQDAITEQVVSSLLVGLNPADPSRAGGRRLTNDPEAYEIYLRAREAWGRRTPESIRRGISLFEQVIAKDPNFARAYAGLADSYSLTASGLMPADRFPKARAAAERALALDDTLAEAHNALAFMSYKWDWQWQRSEQAFTRAIELDPSYVLAHHWYGEFLSVIGRHDAGLRELARAQELDPYSTAIRVDVAAALVRASRLDEAVKVLQEAIAREPSAPALFNALHNAHRAAGRDAQAFDALLRFRALGGASEQDLDALRTAYRGGGMRAITQAELERILDADKRGAANSITSLAATIARNYAILGDRDNALSWLEEATRRRDDGPLTTRAAWYWKPYREEPRFKAIEKIVGMPN